MDVINLKISKLKGRYLNADAAFKVSLENGLLLVTLETAAVKGRPLPARFINRVQKQNLAREVVNDPDNVAALRKYASITVTNSLLIIKIKPKI